MYQITFNWCMQQKYGAYKTRRNSTYQKIKVLKETGKLTPTQLTSLAGGPGGKVLWPCPTLPNAKITSNYGMRGAIAGTSHKTANFHNGVDIGVPSGTPVVAVASGQVIVSGFNAGGYGNWVVIKHPQLNIVSLYAHGTSRKATVGAQVSAGQEILISGSTGNSSGPHLHFTLANGQDANSSTIGNSKVGAAKSFDPLPWIKG